MALTPSGSQIDNPGGSGGGVTSVNTLTGAVVITAGIVGAVPRPNTRRWAYMCATGQTSPASPWTSFGVGDSISPSSSNGTITGAQASSTLPPILIASTGAATSAQCVINSSSAYIVGRNIRAQWYAGLNQVTTVRAWLGLVSADIHTTDTPVSSMAAFRFSTNVAGETGWTCYIADGSTAQTTLNVVPIDTNMHKFEIIENTATTTWTFYIDGNLVATMNTHPPAASTKLTEEFNIALYTGSTSRSLNWAWAYIESDF